MLKSAAKDIELRAKSLQRGDFDFGPRLENQDLADRKRHWKLSGRRSDAVTAYMAARGVQAHQTGAFGFGEPLAVPEMKCNDALRRKALIACLAPNRRVAVKFQGDAK